MPEAYISSTHVDWLTPVIYPGTTSAMPQQHGRDSPHSLATAAGWHLMERRVRGNLILESWNCLTLSRLQRAGGTVAVLMIWITGGLALCLDPISCGRRACVGHRFMIDCQDVVSLRLMRPHDAARPFCSHDCQSWLLALGEAALPSGSSRARNV